MASISNRTSDNLTGVFSDNVGKHSPDVRAFMNFMRSGSEEWRDEVGNSFATREFTTAVDQALFDGRNSPYTVQFGYRSFKIFKDGVEILAASHGSGYSYEWLVTLPFDTAASSLEGWAREGDALTKTFRHHDLALRELAGRDVRVDTFVKAMQGNSETFLANYDNRTYLTSGEFFYSIGQFQKSGSPSVNGYRFEIENGVVTVLVRVGRGSDAFTKLVGLQVEGESKAFYYPDAPAVPNGWTLNE